MAKRISPEIKQKACEMFQSGMKISHVARELGISSKSVQRILTIETRNSSSHESIGQIWTRFFESFEIASAAHKKREEREETEIINGDRNEPI